MDKLPSLKDVINDDMDKLKDIPSKLARDMKEIIYKKPKVKYHNDQCPNCKTHTLVEGHIPCPGGKPGCMVFHIGLRCTNCGKIYSQ